ncbi:hypothetical protein COOONC_05006 [Cooperia oncophora]
MTAEECQDYYRLNAAMVEVFYETLNHEVIQESEAYGFVNLVADFGGHLGLWLGRDFRMHSVSKLDIHVISYCIQDFR